jgi:hypothetical protein
VELKSSVVRSKCLQILVLPNRVPTPTTAPPPLKPVLPIFTFNFLHASPSPETSSFITTPPLGVIFSPVSNPSISRPSAHFHAGTRTGEPFVSRRGFFLECCRDQSQVRCRAWSSAIYLALNHRRPSQHWHRPYFGSKAKHTLGDSEGADADSKSRERTSTQELEVSLTGISTASTCSLLFADLTCIGSSVYGPNRLLSVLK